MQIHTIVITTDGARPLNADGSRAPGRVLDTAAVEGLFGGDVWAAGAVRRREKPDEARIRAALASDTRLQNGKWLCEHIEAVLSADRATTLKALAFLEHCFPFVTLRVPAVADYLDWTGLSPDDAVLDLLLHRFEPKPGHPVGWVRQVQLCCWMDELKDEQGMSYARAAEELHRRGAREYAASSLRTLRSRLGRVPRVFAQGYYVPSRRLRPTAWGSKSKRWTLYMPHSEMRPVEGYSGFQRNGS